MIVAVVPAAGRSRRLGRPKLLLDFQGESLIHRVVTALRDGGADRVVVVPPVDWPEAPEIAAEASAAGAEVVIPEVQPPEMRESVELALAVLDAEPRPAAVLLTPADVPGITAHLVALLADLAAAHPDRILIPTRDGHRGHPILLPWELAVRVRDLPDDAGVNRLVELHHDRVLEVPVSGADAIDDLDTPEDLVRWQALEARTDPPAATAGRTIAVRVRLFALARERAGRSEIDLVLPDPATVGLLRTALGESVPDLAALCSGAMISVDEEYASDESPVLPTSRLALIPPVSGGGPDRPDREASNRDD